MQNLFITGTDTGVGKTWMTLGLMAKLQRGGLLVNGMKPVASGSEWHAGGLRNADAVSIRNQSSRPGSYAQVNPYTFAEPIAPHLAAGRHGVQVDIEALAAAFDDLARAADLVIVEGVGGWRAPLSESVQTRDLVKRLNLSVIMVVGLRLGCINHALLTAESIRLAGLPLAGWLANGICREYTETPGTLEYLSGHIPAPLLGVVPCLDRFDREKIAAAIEDDRLPPG